MARIPWKKLTISLDGLDPGQLLAEWRWLVPETVSPVWLSGFGDWAFASQDGRIHFLDLLEGTFNCIAPSESALDKLLQSEENQNRWLMADWVAICRDQGLLLAEGECYGWKVAPVLGGKFEFLNIQVFDIVVYQCIMGQVHRQVQGLPQGFIITEFKMGCDPKA